METKAKKLCACGRDDCQLRPENCDESIGVFIGNFHLPKGTEKRTEMKIIDNKSPYAINFHASTSNMSVFSPLPQQISDIRCPWLTQMHRSEDRELRQAVRTEFQRIQKLINPVEISEFTSQNSAGLRGASIRTNCILQNTQVKGENDIGSSYTWTDESRKEVIDARFTKLASGELEIANANITDSGIYTCKVRQQTTSKNIELEKPFQHRLLDFDFRNSSLMWKTSETSSACNFEFSDPLVLTDAFIFEDISNPTGGFNFDASYIKTGLHFGAPEISGSTSIKKCRTGMKRVASVAFNTEVNKTDANKDRNDEKFEQKKKQLDRDPYKASRMYILENLSIKIAEKIQELQGALRTFDCIDSNLFPEVTEVLLNEIKRDMSSVCFKHQLSEKKFSLDPNISNRKFCYIVPDTNIFLRKHTYINHLKKCLIEGHLVHIYVAYIVLEELDRLKKKGSENVRYMARRAIAFLNEMLPTSRFTGQSPLQANSWALSFPFKKVNDNQLLETCLGIKRNLLAEEVILITNDINLTTKAQTLFIRSYSADDLSREVRIDDLNDADEDDDNLNVPFDDNNIQIERDPMSLIDPPPRLTLPEGDNDGMQLIKRHKVMPLVDQLGSDFESVDQVSPPDMLSPDISHIAHAECGNYVIEAHQFVQNSDITERFREWEQSVKPFLEEMEQRESFDINLYGYRILNSFEDSNRKQAKALREICGSMEKREIHRHFMAVLSLANMGKVQLDNEKKPDGTEEIFITLLSRKMHHKELEEFGHNEGEHS